MTRVAVDSISAAAVDWMVRLTSGQIGEAERAAFAQWLDADIRHRAAWEEIDGLLAAPVAQLQSVERRAPGQLAAARRALSAPASPQRRRLLGSSLMLFAVAAAGGFALQRRTPLSGMIADIATATGERAQRQLPDGSGLILNARSVADIDFSAQRRRVYLCAGELVVDIADDAQRAFEIVTPRGVVHAARHRVLAKSESARDLVVALDQRATVLGAGMERALAEGQGAALYDDRIDLFAQLQRARAAWIDGLLDVRDQPLGEVIESLSAYRRGLLRVAPEVAELRVFGIFHLDDTDAALRALAETLPIDVHRYGSWLTMVERRAT